MEESGKIKSVACNMIWNSVGSSIFLFSQWLATIMAVRLSDNGYLDAGMLALATSITGVFCAVASYSVRNYQVSDIGGRFSNADYIFHRIVFILVADVALEIFLWAGRYSAAAAAVISVYMVYRNCSIFADVFAGIAQKYWRMDIGGVSMAIRGILDLLLFCTVMYWTGSLLLAIAVMTLGTVACLFLIDIQGTKRLCSLSIKPNMSMVWKLTAACFPMFCNSLLSNVMIVIPRLFLEKLYGEEMLGYYMSVATPALIVQVGAGYIFSPFISVFSEYYMKKDRRFISLFWKIGIIILAIESAAIPASGLLGKWILPMIFGESIRGYVYLFPFTIALSLTNGILCFVQMVLIVVRGDRCLVLGGCCGVISCAGLAGFLIPRLGIDGVVSASIFSAAIQITVLCMGIFAAVRQRWKKMP